MRIVLIAALVALTGPAFALPRWAPAPDVTVKAVQNRFLPQIFGKNEQNQPSGADAELRIQQLETQVRALTGQVEQLTFTVRRLQSLLEQGGSGLPGQSGAARPGLTGGSQQGSLGAPPSSLGQLPTQPQQAQTSSASGGETYTGPVDLSALNGALNATPPPSSTSAAVSNAAPASNSALDEVRNLQQSGRFAMAADAARVVLTDNPTGPIAGEARFLLGEALLAQQDYRGAANQFLETYTADPNGARAPESLLKLGTSLNGLGEREAACSSLEELFGAYPNVSGSLRARAEAERRAANCA